MRTKRRLQPYLRHSHGTVEKTYVRPSDDTDSPHRSHVYRAGRLDIEGIAARGRRHQRNGVSKVRPVVNALASARAQQSSTLPFNVRMGDELLIDRYGVMLPDVTDAIAEALMCAQVQRTPPKGGVSGRRRFEIVDRGGKLLATVPID